MRKLYLWWQGTRKYLLLDVFLLFAITVSLYSFSNALGIYRMSVLSESLLKDTFENPKSVYYMELYAEEQRVDIAPEDNLAENRARYASLQALSEQPCVEAVHYRLAFSASTRDSHHNIGVYSRASLPMFPVLYRGAWPETAVDESGNFNAVVYGSRYANMEIGSVITASAGGREIRIKICGEIHQSMPVPNFAGFGSYNNASNIYSPGESGIVLLEDPLVLECVWAAPNSLYSLQMTSYIVEFKEGAAQQDMAAVVNKLAESGGVSYMDSILRNTEEYSAELFKIKMTVPIFYTVISFCAFLCITILYVIKRSREMAVYHLLGYSKARMGGSIILRIASLIAVAGAVNVGYVKCYYELLARNLVTAAGRPPYFDDRSVWIVVAIVAVMFLVVVTAALCTLRSRTPKDLHHLSEE